MDSAVTPGSDRLTMFFLVALLAACLVVAMQRGNARRAERREKVERALKDLSDVIGEMLP